jgi:hypothetical protein
MEAAAAAVVVVVVLVEIQVVRVAVLLSLQWLLLLSLVAATVKVMVGVREPLLAYRAGARVRAGGQPLNGLSCWCSCSCWRPTAQWPIVLFGCLTR